MNLTVLLPRICFTAWSSLCITANTGNYFFVRLDSVVSDRLPLPYQYMGGDDSGDYQATGPDMRGQPAGHQPVGFPVTTLVEGVRLNLNSITRGRVERISEQ